MKHISALTIVLALAGCASPYTSPTSGPNAKIRFVNDAQRNLNIAYFDTSTKCVGRRQTEVIRPTTEHEHVVRANGELTFQYFLTNQPSWGGEQYCLINLRFFPKEGSSYIFRTTESSNSCNWLMVDATQSGNPKPEPLKRILWKRGFYESSSFCSE
jgi:hypothetical protein